MACLAVVGRKRTTEEAQRDEEQDPDRVINLTACHRHVTTEKTSPLTQQKRCSLPGPMGALNLYATHQQRRLSERGLMIYRPNKPDIDLIRDFTNSSKKTTPSFMNDRCDPSSSGCSQQRRHSTAINLMTSASAVTTPSSSNPWPGNYTTERRHSSIIPGASPTTFLSSTNFPSSSANNNNNPSYGQSTLKHFQQVKPLLHHPSSASTSTPSGSGGGSYNGTASTAGFNAPGNHSGGSALAPSPDVSAIKGHNNSKQNPSGCRKVRLRIQKNPGAKDKFFELTPIISRPSLGYVGDTSGLGEEDDMVSFLRRPHCDNRRFSDSAASVRHPPHICITPDVAALTGRPYRGGGLNKDNGIVCSTGDLLTLKCLTSSAQEIRYAESSGSQVTSVSDLENSSPQSLGNRSRSFDATIVMARKGPGSSWFSRRHQPIAVKLPLPINSPTISSPGDTRYFPGSAAGILRTPILTITNENASKSELIEIPSPPAATPASSRSSPEEKTKVAWDKNGFVLDAAVLGIAIENHLRKVDMRRRATFSALYQPPPTLLESKVPTRARSASACVIPICVPVSNEEDESIGSRSKSTSSRKSSLSSATITGGRLFCWDRGGGGVGAGGSVTAGPTVTATTVSFTGASSAAGQSTYETYLHRLPINMGMSASIYMNNLDSPSSDSFVNFRATEDDIEEENLVGEEGEDTAAVVDDDDDDDDDGDEDAHERQAFLRGSQKRGRSAADRHQNQQQQSKKKSSGGGSMATASASSASSTSKEGTLRQNEGNQSAATGGSNNSSRGNGMSICSAIRDFILQSIRS